MERRTFIGALASALAVAGISSVATAAGLSAPETKPYATLEHISVIVSGNGADNARLIFRDGSPQRVPIKGSPIAVSFEEHDADSVRMNVYAIEANGKYRLLDYSYAGFYSRQNLGNYGVSLVVNPQTR